MSYFTALKRSVLGLGIYVAMSGIATAQTASEILEKSDFIRNPQQSFVVDVNLKQYENGKLIDKTLVKTHSRMSDEGQFLTIVHIDKPVVDKGKLLLRNDNILWFYDNKSKASVRMSPRQRLLGNASNGDVITSNFIMDYLPELETEEVIFSGDKKERSSWKLKLDSTNDFAPYDSVDLWVDQENYRPLKAKFYGSSGKLLKVAWYRGWKKVLGETRPTEVVISDGFNTKKVTVMTMNNHEPLTLPQSWFNKEWLPHFTSAGA